MPYSLYHVCQQQFRWIINLLNKFKHKCQKFFESEIIWRCHLVPWDCPVISRLIKNEIIFGRHGYIQTASKSVTNQIFFLIMWLRSVLIMTVWTEQITWNLMFSILIWATFTCGAKSDADLMLCNATSVQTVRIHATFTSLTRLNRVSGHQSFVKRWQLLRSWNVTIPQCCQKYMKVKLM